MPSPLQTRGLKNYNTVVRLLEVMTQVVAGVNYNLTFTTAPSHCVIGKVRYMPHVCMPAEQENALCSAIIYVIPWMHSASVTKYTCSTIKHRDFSNQQVQVSMGTHKARASTII
ncbi:cystatin-1-like [Dermacentor silvarum]|uniref:cystatin-1-like n=1 Tax=Dermacentor silvarum TaxID=543639 RepID=UPI00189B3B58|nr:cystatin-1-like [Dermacentor silvarum]